MIEYILFDEGLRDRFLKVVADQGIASEVRADQIEGFVVALPDDLADEVIDIAVVQRYRARGMAGGERGGREGGAPMPGRLLKLADAIEQRAEQFARLESLNCGKPYARALGDEIPAVADCFRYFAGAVRALAQRAVAVRHPFRRQGGAETQVAAEAASGGGGHGGALRGRC